MFEKNVASRLGMLTRRRVVCIGVAFGVATFMKVPACAEPVLQHPVLEIFQPGWIAVPDFLASGPADADSARAISEIIATDLKRSGVVEPLDPAVFIGKIVNIDASPQFSDWRAIKQMSWSSGASRACPTLVSRLSSGFGVFLVARNLLASNISARPTNSAASPT
jgi:TolB protein